MAQKYYTSYDEWAADHMENGKLKDGTSVADQKVGEYLKAQQNKKENLTENFNTAVSELGKQEEKAIADADILNQRMQKYLPQQLAAQGLYGTGMSEDAYLKLQKQYNDSVTSANDAYSSGYTDLKSVYDSSMLKIDEDTVDKVDSIMKDAETERKEAEAAAFAEAETGLANITFDDAKAVEDYINGYKGKVSESDFQILTSKARVLIKDNYSDTASGASEGTQDFINNNTVRTLYADDHDSLNNGDDIKVEIGETTYTVESDGEASETVKKYADEKGVTEDSFFIYENKIYFYSGKVAYKVTAKSESDKYKAHYNDILEYLKTGKKGKNLDKYNKSAKSASALLNQWAVTQGNMF